MKHTYHIQGMTCNGCRSHVEETLSKVEGVSKAIVDLEKLEAIIEMESHIPIETFQKALKNDGGRYSIHKQDEHHQHSEVKKSNQLKGKEVIIIGSGVGGLTTAYELLAQQSDVKVTILGASHKTGGRCMSLRTGDTLIEDANSDLFNSKPGKPQVIRFKRPVVGVENSMTVGKNKSNSEIKGSPDGIKERNLLISVDNFLLNWFRIF